MLENFLARVVQDLFQAFLMKKTTPVNNLLENQLNLGVKQQSPRSSLGFVSLVEMGGIEPPSDIWILTLLRV
jgi:hypothetical protein